MRYLISMRENGQAWSVRGAVVGLKQRGYCHGGTISFAMLMVLMLFLMCSCRVDPMSQQRGESRTDHTSEESYREALLNELLLTVEGPPDDNTRASKDSAGYIRTIGAGRSSHFALPGCAGMPPEKQVGYFINEYQGLISDEMPHVSYRRMDSGTRSLWGGHLWLCAAV